MLKGKPSNQSLSPNVKMEERPSPSPWPSPQERACPIGAAESQKDEQAPALQERTLWSGAKIDPEWWKFPFQGSFQTKKKFIDA